MTGWSPELGDVLLEQRPGHPLLLGEGLGDSGASTVAVRGCASFSWRVRVCEGFVTSHIQRKM